MRQPWMRLDPSRLVFIDETSLNTKMTRFRGRSRRGSRLRATAPFGRWGTQTFIAGLRCDSLTAPWIIPGAMNRIAFNTYIETQLAPTLQKGDVVVLDNLPAHKRDDARQAVERRGAWLLFLPPYSPDFNPIELAFSKFKAHMKRLKPRTIDDLWKAAGKVCDLFKPEECMNFFVADGYAPE